MANGANYWDMDDKIKYFWARIDKRGEDECWPWTGPRNTGGTFGEFRFKGKDYSAHRAAWEIQNDRMLTRDMLVTQSCSNPLCCNPRHLFVKSRRKEQIEMVKKRSHAPTKLSEDQVIEIRRIFEAGGITKTELGKLYGVSPHTINDIVNRTTWNWVESS